METRRLSRPSARIGMALVVCLVLAFSGAAWGSSTKVTGSVSGARSDRCPAVPKKSIVYAQLVGDASEIALRESTAVKLATTALCWNLTYIQAAGNIPNMIQGISAGINRGANAVLIASTDAPLVKQALDLAKQKHVPVIGVGGGAPLSSDYTVQYQENEVKMATLLTKQIIKDLKGSGTLAAVNNSQISAGKFRQQGRDAALRGTNVKIVAQQDSDLADLVGGTKTSVAAMLTQHPDVNALWLVYDAMMPPALEVLNGRNNTTTKVYSWFANPSNLEVMRKNKNVQALIDGNLDHTDLIALDQLARYFKYGTKPDPAALKKCEMGYKVISRSNLPPAGNGGVEAIPYPPAKDAQPFIRNWRAGKFGKGAGCA